MIPAAALAVMCPSLTIEPITGTSSWTCGQPARRGRGSPWFTIRVTFGNSRRTASCWSSPEISTSNGPTAVAFGTPPSSARSRAYAVA